MPNSAWLNAGSARIIWIRSASGPFTGAECGAGRVIRTLRAGACANSPAKGIRAATKKIAEIR